MNKQEFLKSVGDSLKNTPRRVLYLDLDGTVRKGFDEIGRFVNGPDDVEIFPEALEKMRFAKAAGWLIAGVSNQGGVALGHLALEDCADAMAKTHTLCERLFDRIAFCIHHPQAKNPTMSACWCRKPRAGMIIEVAHEFGRTRGGMYPPNFALMVGDRPEDAGCAENAGVPFMDAKEWRAMPMEQWQALLSREAA